MNTIWLYVLLGCTKTKDTDIDVDGDGFVASEDCNDEDANINPSAQEVCNEIDDNCDGQINNNPVDGAVYLADVDGDGFGDDSSPHHLCAAEMGYVESSSGGDCNDTNATIYPGASERCNNIDDDCDSEIDDNPEDGNFYYRDADQDGFGTEIDVLFLCTQPEGYVLDGGDCDDSHDKAYPGVAYQDSSEDCMLDADGDGYGDAASVGSIVAGTDCDDAQENVFPGAIEYCNNIDDDCDELIDDADDNVSDQLVLYHDLDGDGYGDPNNSVLLCTATQGTVADASDCNDADAEIHPAAIEICDGIDNDCEEASSEEGMVYMVNSQGQGLDVTSSFSQGTPSAPAVYTPTGAEDLYFCTGTYSPVIETTFDIAVRSIGDVTFTADGNNAASYDIYAIKNTGDGTHTQLEGILFDGYNLAVVVLPENEVSSTVAIDDILVRNGISSAGAGIVIGYSELVLSNSFFEDGYSGYFGLAVTSVASTVSLDNVDISNTSPNGHIGIYAIDASDVDLVDTHLSGLDGMGLYLKDSTGSCAHSTASLEAGFSNSEYGLVLDNSTWESDLCDYEQAVSTEDNGIDIQIIDGPGYYVGNNTTFSCDATSCGSAYTRSFSGPNSTSASSKLLGNSFIAQEDVTINAFSTYLNGYGCGASLLTDGLCICTLDFAMHIKNALVWEEVWTNTKSYFMDGSVFAGNIGIPVHAGEEVALTTAYDCSFAVSYQYGSISTLSSNPFLNLNVGLYASNGNTAQLANTSENSLSYYGQIVNISSIP